MIWKPLHVFLQKLESLFWCKFPSEKTRCRANNHHDDPFWRGRTVHSQLQYGGDATYAGEKGQNLCFQPDLAVFQKSKTHWHFSQFLLWRCVWTGTSSANEGAYVWEMRQLKYICWYWCYSPVLKTFPRRSMLALKLKFNSILEAVIQFFRLTNCERKKKYAAFSTGSQGKHPRNKMSRENIVRRLIEDAITQVSEETERRKNKKFTQDFRRTASRFLGSQSKLDKIHLNLQFRVQSETALETSWMIKRKTRI